MIIFIIIIIIYRVNKFYNSRHNCRPTDSMFVNDQSNFSGSLTLKTFDIIFRFCVEITCWYV